MFDLDPSFSYLLNRTFSLCPYMITESPLIGDIGFPFLNSPLYCLQLLLHNRKPEIMAESGRVSGYRFSYRQMMLGFMLLMLIKIGAAQTDANTCVSLITPCANYLNATTKPPDSCCLPLLDVIQTQEKCLCSVLNSSFIKQMGINITQALNVPRLCGDKNVTTNACSTATAKAPPASTTPSGTADTSDSSGIGATSLQISLPLLAILSLGVFKSFP